MPTYTSDLLRAHRQGETHAKMTASESLAGDVDTFQDWLAGHCANRTEAPIHYLVTQLDADALDATPVPVLVASLMLPWQGKDAVCAIVDALVRRREKEHADLWRKHYDRAIGDWMEAE